MIITLRIIIHVLLYPMPVALCCVEGMFSSRTSIYNSDCIERIMGYIFIVHDSCVHNINITGLLDPPPGLRVDRLNSTTLFLSWNPPSTLSGIPILYYSVEVNNLVATSTINATVADQPSNMTSVDLSSSGSIGYLYAPDCESLMFTVRAWNSVGGGAGSVAFYSQGTECIEHIHYYNLVNQCNIINNRITSNHQGLHCITQPRCCVCTVWVWFSF